MKDAMSGLPVQTFNGRDVDVSRYFRKRKDDTILLTVNPLISAALY